MSRGRTPRNCLHQNKLSQFERWALAHGYVHAPIPRPHAYEVLRIKLYDPAGDHPHIVIYRRERTPYLTAPRGDALDLVNRWFSERGQKSA